MSLKVYASNFVSYSSDDGQMYPCRKIGFTSRSIKERFFGFDSSLSLKPKWFVELPKFLSQNKRVDQLIDWYFDKYRVNFSDAWSTELYACDDDTTKKLLKKLAKKWDGHFHTASESNIDRYFLKEDY